MINIEWPEELVDSIARRRSVLYLGSGISANSTNSCGKRPATWEGFLSNIISNHKLNSRCSELTTLLNEKNYLMACELIVNVIGQKKFEQEVENEFRKPGYIPSDIHKIIYGLDSRLVITPNVDKIYDQCAMAESQSTVVPKKYYESDLAKYLRTDNYLIIKAHGTVDEASKMIFTHKQYSIARCMNSAFYKLLDSLILTHTFIFLGCGINDPDISLTLENANFLYEGCLPHYFVTSKNSISDNMCRVLQENRNIEVITYQNTSGNHSELLKELEELKKKVEEKRNALSQTLTW